MKSMFLLIIVLFAGGFQQQSISTHEDEFPVLKGPYLGQKPPGDVPEEFLPEIFKETHSSLVFSPDGRQVYWRGNEPKRSLLFMEETNGIWSTPDRVTFRSMFYRQDVPFFSVDGKKLYFISVKPQQWYQLFSDEGIWYVERKGKRWSGARQIGTMVNELYTHWQFSVSANGNLYMAGSEDNEHDIWHIYKSETVNNRYTKPQKLTDSINISNVPMPYSQISPFIAPDESYLIFSGSGASDSFGRGDLYISYRKKDGSWTRAKNMGNSINTRSMEVCPIVSPDGKYLFFMRQETIMWVSAKIIEELRQTNCIN